MNNTNILEKLQDLSNSQVDMFNQNESNNNFESAPLNCPSN